MSNGKTYPALMISILILGASGLDAGTMTPYQAVVFNQRLLDNPPGQDSIVIVDMATGEQIEIPVETPGATVQGPGTMAADTEGAVYVYYGQSSLVHDERGPASLLARLDSTLSEWTVTMIPGETDFPSGMEFTPGGNLVLNGEFGYRGIPVGSDTERWGINVYSQLAGEGEPRYGTIRVDDSGTVTAVAWGENRNTRLAGLSLFRQTLDADVAERWDPEALVYHFALDVDGSLIAPGYAIGQYDPLDPGRLYRLDFDTKSVDMIFESDLLKRAGPIELDPDGRIVTLANEYPDPGASIVRVDLELGTAEVIAHVDSDSDDFDLRIIPEPESALLLILGCLCRAVCLRSRDRRATSSDERRRSPDRQAVLPEKL